VDLGWPADVTLYKLLTDWGSFFAGIFALIAGAVAYIGAKQAAVRQIAALTRKDRLQARGIVVGVYPELLALKVMHDRASKIIHEQFPLAKNRAPVQIVSVVQSAHIELPPLLARNVDNFFLVEPGGASLLQVVSFTLQYNDLVQTLTQQVAQNVVGFDPPAHQQALAGHLRAVAIALKDAMREIGPIHDEATDNQIP